MKKLWKHFLIWWHKRQYQESLNLGRINGKFYVRYKDGQRSINMYYRTAKDYAEIFGGEVICIIEVYPLLHKGTK